MQCRNEQKETDSWTAISNNFLINDSWNWLFFKAFLTLSISHWYGREQAENKINKQLSSFYVIVSHPWSERTKKKINRQ